MNFHAKQFIGRPGPIMAIEIDVHIEWPREPSFFLGLSGQMAYGNVVVSDTVRFEKASYWGDGMSGSTLITRDRGNYGGKLFIPIRNEALHYIEDNRHDQDVPLRIDLSYVWQEAILTPVEKDKPPRYIAGAVRSDTGTVYDCVIKRSDSQTSGGNEMAGISIIRSCKAAFAVRSESGSRPRAAGRCTNVAAERGLHRRYDEVLRRV